MRARVGFGFVTWPQNSEHLERGMLMKAVGMWDCSGLFVLPALNEDRFHFLSGVISPGRSRAGSWDFLPVCTAYHKNIKKNNLMCSDPSWKSYKKKMCFHPGLSKEETVLLHMAHYIWENSLLHCAVLYSSSFIYFALWGQLCRENMGHDLWQWAKSGPVIAAAEECVFVSNCTGIQNKLLMSHWTAAVVLKTHPCRSKQTDF